ncbi:MAG: hypothetical protein IPM92_02705 [Saprospiraceae bacterium]|nr:hypothetical protein [Saprospiraceae bacterium]
MTFQIQFKLRQHTPIIHFQWNENNASLRPTELKSKLDKWLIAILANELRGNEKRREAALKTEKLKKWLRGAKLKDKSNPAFNYSVKISTIGNNKFEDEINIEIDENNPINPKLRNTDYPTYFGNQLKVKAINANGSFHPEDEYRTGKKRIKRLNYFTGVIITFSSPFEDLLAEINNQFPSFLLKTNFGTRQGKGFGSFFIEKGAEGFPENYDNWFNRKFSWKFDVTVEGNTEEKRMKNLFEKIDLFYKTLRSGINTKKFGGHYFKSLMWKYVKEDQKLQWDKKTIKQKFFLNNYKSTPENESTQKIRHNVIGIPSDNDSPLFWEEAMAEIFNKFLWRDLLGLSSVQQWKDYKLPNTNNHATVYKEHIPSGNNQKIDRFKSPIFFKPIRTDINKFRVFFEVPSYIQIAFAQNDQKGYADETAILGETIKIGTTSNLTLGSWGLKFPDSFNYNRFLAHVLNTTNLATYVKVKSPNDKSLKSLQEIFNQLKPQAEAIFIKLNQQQQ